MDAAARWYNLDDLPSHQIKVASHIRHTTSHNGVTQMIAFILEHLHNIEMCNGKHMGRSGNPDSLRVKCHSGGCRFTTNNMEKIQYCNIALT